MPAIEVRDMTPDDEPYVGTCSRVGQSDEIEECGRRRVQLLRRMYQYGLRVKVGLVNGAEAGLLYTMPSQISPWGPVGEDLMVITCAYVQTAWERIGLGRALVETAEEEARRQSAKAIAAVAYYRQDRRISARFFEQLGYRAADRRPDPSPSHIGIQAVVWKPLDPSALPPRLAKRNHQYRPTKGKVVVDLFHTDLCRISSIEAERVRKVAREFGDKVLLNQHATEAPEVRDGQPPARAIFVNGREIGWGYSAPVDGLREEIQKALVAGLRG